MTCVALFGASSLLCGLAPSLPLLLFFRVLQGACGGGLGPSEQTILTDTFPPEKRSQAFAVYGCAVVMAPVLGPTVGGWITENYSWRWIFFINPSQTCGVSELKYFELTDTNSSTQLRLLTSADSCLQSRYATHEMLPNFPIWNM